MFFHDGKHTERPQAARPPILPAILYPAAVTVSAYLLTSSGIYAMARLYHEQAPALLADGVAAVTAAFILTAMAWPWNRVLADYFEPRTSGPAPDPQRTVIEVGSEDGRAGRWLDASPELARKIVANDFDLRFDLYSSQERSELSRLRKKLERAQMAHKSGKSYEVNTPGRVQIKKLSTPLPPPPGR